MKHVVLLITFLLVSCQSQHPATPPPKSGPAATEVSVGLVAQRDTIRECSGSGRGIV